MIRATLLALAALMLAGCATTTGLSTASGRPEATVHGTVSATKAKISNAMLDRGYTPKGATENSLAFGKQVSMASAGTVWLTAMSGPVTGRVEFSVVDVSNGEVRVVANAHMIEWEGSPRERSLEGGTFTVPEATLNDVKAVLASLN